MEESRVTIARELSTLYANLRGEGLGMAAKYAAFRWLFSVHSRPAAWALSHLAPYPVLLEVEISTACNLSCAMCELSLGYERWGQPARFMSYENVIGVLDQFPHLIWCDWTGIGEPLLHPRFLEIVAEFKRRQLYVECFDNFTGWDERITDFMLEHRLNRVQPSVDGATKQTYEHIRVGADFDVVCRNLRYLFDQKRRRKSPLPIIDMHYIVQESNHHEMEEFVRLTRSLAGDQRVGVQFTEMLRNISGLSAKKVAITDRDISQVLRAGREEGVQVWVNRNAEGKPKADMRRCNAWYMPFITVDGFVYPCCAENERGDRKWQNDRAMGNILTQPFRSIWTGGPYTALRRLMRQGGTPPYCEGCPVFKAQA